MKRIVCHVKMNNNYSESLITSVPAHYLRGDIYTYTFVYRKYIIIVHAKLLFSTHNNSYLKLLCHSKKALN